MRASRAFWPTPRATYWADSTGRGNTSMGGRCDGQAGGVDEGVDGPVADEVAGRAVAAARCRASVLGADRGGLEQRGGGAGSRGIAGGWHPMVPGAWRHGDVHARRGLVPVLVLRGTRGDRDAAGARRRGARDRPPARSFAVDDLARAEAQRGHSWRQARVPRVRRAVEGGADRSPAEDREARRRRGTARVRAATASRRGSPAGWGRRGPDDAAVERPQQAPPAGSPVGDGVEPGADRQPAEG